MRRRRGGNVHITMGGAWRLGDLPCGVQLATLSEHSGSNDNIRT
jgi:hypothetical protein